jgi:hypothetical protein
MIAAAVAAGQQQPHSDPVERNTNSLEWQVTMSEGA